MEKSDQSRESTWNRANWLSKFFLAFAFPLLRKDPQQIKRQDLGDPPAEDASKELGESIESLYLERSKHSAAFFRVILGAFKWRLAAVCLLQTLLGCLVSPLQLLSVGWLVRDIQRLSSLQEQADLSPGRANHTEPFRWSLEDARENALSSILHDTALLLATSWFASLANHWIFVEGAHLGMKFRLSACRLIYRKSLRLSQASQSKVSNGGQITNLLSNDVNRFDRFAYELSQLCKSPIQVSVMLAILSIQQVGLVPVLACLVGIACFIVIQICMGGQMSRVRRMTAERTDKRVGLIHELMASIRVIKLYAWEEPFKQLVDEYRSKELNVIALTSALHTAYDTIYLGSVRVLLYIVIVVYVLLGNPLEPATLFAIAGLVNQLGYALTYDLQHSIINIAETVVSCSRIDRFLQLDELHCSPSSGYRHKPTGDSTGSLLEPSLRLTNVSAHWSSAESKLLRNISLTVEPNELLIVAGRVGSGKTSFLMSLLGELPLAAGSLELNGRISFAPQEAWIFAGTVRENILLGEPFDANRYSEIIRICSLVQDFQIMPASDSTVIGERGVSLSGGQKARINLARALYRRADIYLLDDPLSGVDAPVAKHIFTEAIQRFLESKTVILVTHQLRFLQQADKVLILDSNQSAVFGRPDQIRNTSAFKLLEFSGDTSRRGSKPLCQSEADQSVTSEKQKTDFGVNGPSKDKTCLPEMMDDEEARMSDGMGWSAFKYYCISGANFFSLFVYTIALTLVRFAFEFNLYFLSLWADSDQKRRLEAESSDLSESVTTNEWILYSGFMLLFLILVTFISAAMNYWIAWRASRKLHRNLFNSLIWAPMKDFDFRPIGSILNRVSRDMGYVDELMPNTLFNAILVLHMIIGIMLMVAIIDISSVIPSLCLIVFALITRHLTIGTIIKLRRLEAAARSPVFSHLSTSLLGLASIRAFGVQDQFMQSFDTIQNEHSSTWFAYIGTSCIAASLLYWLALAAITVIILVKICLTLGETSASLIGLMAVRLITIPEHLDYVFRCLVELESQVTSVSRIKEYSEWDPEEKPGANNSSPKELVPAGRIQFEQVSLSYSSDKSRTLDDISLDIRSGEKIGIVGRTGAGKSSIISALFRLYNFEGRILIDGQDIKQVSLRQLRSSISIIPQDPVLFAGSLRKNLDPFDEHSDGMIWNSLDAVELKSVFANFPKGLEFEIDKSGGNLSVGQRQLICLARAILKSNKILVLDEATANVDLETDSFIQRTIRHQFKACTVLTVAHRLSTIADSDRILVLDHGKVIEFDEPSKLIQNESSKFSQMLDCSSDV